jgi:hypothetical protein
LKRCMRCGCELICTDRLRAVVAYAVSRRAERFVKRGFLP